MADQQISHAAIQPAVDPAVQAALNELRTELAGDYPSLLFKSPILIACNAPTGRCGGRARPCFFQTLSEPRNALPPK